MKNKKLVIYGIGETADIAYEYFTHDSAYEVVAFTADADYKKEDTHLGLPVVDFAAVITKNRSSSDTPPPIYLRGV